MGTVVKVVVLSLFVSSLLFSLVSSASNDGLVRIGLKKMNLDRSSWVVPVGNKREWSKVNRETDNQTYR